MIINLKDIVNSDVSQLERYYPEEYRRHKFNFLNVGIEYGEHYKLLNYFGEKIFNGQILLDMGTRSGISALALGLSRKNKRKRTCFIPLNYKTL